MNKITVAKLIANKIQDWGIKKVFVFQGGAVANILSEIGKNKNIKYYCPYHEQSMAMAVDAFSRVGKMSAGFVTSGPGATNLLTGVACSYYDSIPAIFFTGQVGQFHIVGKKKVRQRGFQESNILSIFKPVTKFCHQIQNPDKAEEILERALEEATTGRPGPVLIDVPFNIQRSLITVKKKLKKKIKKNKDHLINKNKLLQFLQLVQNSKKPLIICGGGVRLSGSEKKFLNFIRTNKLPFVTTWPAQDIADYDFALNCGSIGRHAHHSANILASEADLIITLGVRFSPKILGKNFAKNANVVSIDIDKFELDQGLYKSFLRFNNNLSFFFKKVLNKKIVKSTNSKWISYCKKTKKTFYTNFLRNNHKEKSINPYYFMNKLSDYTKKNSILITDAGCNLTYFMQAYKNKNNQRILSAWGNSPMGYSIAAGIGVKLAKPKLEVVSLIGDGSFLINLQDLQFIKYNKINLKIIIIDNQIFGNTKIGCEMYKIKNVGNDSDSGYFPPEVKKISKAFDIKYFNIKKESETESVLKNFFNQKISSILHVEIPKNSPLIEHKI
jgi:acetolactate synthase I/II/III large subunit